VRGSDRGGELTRCGRYVWHQQSRQHAQPLLFWFCSQVIGSRGLVHRTLLLSNLHFFVEVLFRRRWNEDCLRDSRDKTLVLAHGSSSAQGQQTFERKRSKFPAKRQVQPGGREGTDLRGGLCFHLQLLVLGFHHDHIILRHKTNNIFNWNESACGWIGLIFGITEDSVLELSPFSIPSV
jgi:hypothetical protein